MNLSTEAHNRIGDVQVKFVIESDETPLGGKTLGSSKGKTNSKDVNEHISVVIAQLVKIDLPDLRKFKCFFDIKWESDYLYAGDGPMISKEVIQEISRFNAGIVFDIYDISDD